MSASPATQPSLSVESQPQDPGTVEVRVRGLDADTMECLESYAKEGGRLQAVLQVVVVQAGTPDGDGLPDIFGHYRLLDDAVGFTPYFPFEPGIAYRAIFDPSVLDRRDSPTAETLDFSYPELPTTLRTAVTQIFPSSDRLPENLLRLYVCFSGPMQRGRAESEISLLDPDGEPAADVLYRAPVELWDRRMRQLTVLLDPGRLKRGVGPHRALGPPLREGLEYTLVVGAGMRDLAGRPLSEAAYKRFRVTAAVREPVAVKQWQVGRPSANTREPLVLVFQRPLDRALLSHAIRVTSTDRQPIEGRVAIDENERRWSFFPTSAWRPGSYGIDVSHSLEDVCGNSVGSAFERPLRPDTDLTYEMADHSIALRVE